MGTNEGTVLGFEAAAAIVTHSCGDIPGKVVVVTRSRSPTQFIRAVIAEAAAEMDLARALDPLSPICAGRREITKVRWRTFAMRKRLVISGA